MSDATESIIAATSTTTEDTSMTPHVAGWLLDHWKLVGAIGLVGAVLVDRHLAYRRGVRDGLVTAGAGDAYDDSDDNA
jgi:hypothetical protein